MISAATNSRAADNTVPAMVTVDQSFLVNETSGFGLHLQDKCMRFLLGFSELRPEQFRPPEGSGGTTPVEPTREDEIAMILNQDEGSRSTFGILVSEEWRFERGFRLYQLEGKEAGELNFSGGICSVSAFEWTPGLDLNPRGVAIIGRQSFSIRSKQAPRVRLQEVAWYPVPIIRRSTQVRGTNQSFLHIFDETEAVTQAYRKLGALEYKALSRELTYQQCLPIVQLKAEPNQSGDVRDKDGTGENWATDSDSESESDHEKVGRSSDGQVRPGRHSSESWCDDDGGENSETQRSPPPHTPHLSVK